MIIHEMYELKMYEFKIYGGVICHENEKRCKTGRGNSSKNLQIIEARPFKYPSYFGFLAILSTLSCNILSVAVLLVKSLKLN